MKKKNVLIMGVHGRIGEHLYLELNESVNLFAFSSPNQEPDHENITFIKKDLFIQLKKLIQQIHHHFTTSIRRCNKGYGQWKRFPIQVVNISQQETYGVP